MKITILGAGLAGLAVCWKCLNQFPHAEITLLDSKGIGGGASGVAAGLLHVYAGRHARKSWMGDEALHAAEKLLAIAQDYSETPIAYKTGLLRVTSSEDQKHSFALCAETYDSVELWTSEQCNEAIPDLAPHLTGLWIPHAWQVNTGAYLQALWKACAAKGAQWKQQHVSSLSELPPSDLKFITAGYHTKLIPELSHLPLHPLKGQILHCQSTSPPLPFPISGSAYLMQDPRSGLLIAGSTYERRYPSEFPDPILARKEISAKITPLYPPFEQCKVLHCKAGIRASAPQHLPLVTKYDSQTWILTGLGSKGLLYHAWIVGKVF